MKNWKSKILAYALKNAVEHEGKALESSVISGLFHEGLEKKDVKDIIKDVKKIVSEVNCLPVEEQEKEFSKLQDEVGERKGREGLPELPEVHGKVIMRIAPYPSGALHIGNTRPLIINDEYVKMYKGKLFLVIDDTIGSGEKEIAPEAYKLIEEGARWLKVKYSKPIIRKSDRLKIYYKYAEEIIKKDKAYVCFCSQDSLRKNREEQKKCEHRNAGVEETLKSWKKMFDMKEGQAVLRIKTSMSDKNPAFRDRVIFRICEREHPRVGKKYKVWPLLDFSWAVDDYLLRITHVVRGKELMIETDMEKYIFDIFGWKQPVFIHTGLFQIAGVKISKSKGQKEIKSGVYTGWDDPRTWSLQSLEKRGLQPEAIRKFIIGLGTNPTEITVPIDILYAENRKILNEKAKGTDFEKNEKGKIKIIMPDAVIVRGSSKIKVKDKDIVYFRNFGFARYDKKSSLFYYSHS